jgi:hypothetical protein
MKTQLKSRAAYARGNMRMWAARWRETRAFRDISGQVIALKRAVIWRETAVTLRGQQEPLNFELRTLNLETGGTR